MGTAYQRPDGVKTTRLTPRWRRHPQRNIHEIIKFLLVFSTQQDRQHPHKAVGYFLLFVLRVLTLPSELCTFYTCALYTFPLDTCPLGLAERIHPGLVITFA